MTDIKNVHAENDKYYLGFSYFLKIGPVNWRYLENYFPDLKIAWHASIYELEKSGLSPKLALKFIRWRKTCDLENIGRELAAADIDYITWHDPKYPSILQEISAPPPVLYYRGKWDGQAKNRLAVVGSRHPSSYAAKIIDLLIPAAAAAGIEIISGLALGVDSLAHRSALAAQGRTIAILGSGLASHNIYPPANRGLAAEIIKSGGAIVSEFPPSVPPYRQNFPQRNRIITGLSQAALIVEAKEKSGALITAAYALEQNREVLAIPGNIFSEVSAGPNNLIKAGAKTITQCSDLLETFKITMQQSRPEQNLTADFKPHNRVEAAVYTLIKNAHDRAESITADEIIKQTRLDTATINSTLSILEIYGIAKNTEFGYDLN